MTIIVVIIIIIIIIIINININIIIINTMVWEEPSGFLLNWCTECTVC